MPRPRKHHPTETTPAPVPVPLTGDQSVRAITEFVHGTTRRQIGDRFTVPAERVSPLETAGLIMSASAERALWHELPGRVLTPEGVPAPVAVTPEAHAVRVLALCGYDPGSAAYRYHSAFNTSPALASLFVRWGDANPHSSLRQLDGTTAGTKLEAAFLTASVLHCHVDYRQLEHDIARLPYSYQLVVRHYHGSIHATAPRVLIDHDADAAYGALQVGARLYHRRFGESVQWLPIPMPVDQYASLVNVPKDGPLRVGHSPTVRAIKGSDELEAVIRDLQAAGREIELVSIENMTHGDALRLKATCHVTFDSFWLGMQGSGLEAASMGQMVVAGDEGARDDYRRELGFCPYTFAADRDELYAVLDRACTDTAWRQAEAARVGEYTRTYHDYPAVAARYISLVRSAWSARGLPAPEVSA
jgi:hypothetical protein